MKDGKAVYDFTDHLSAYSDARAVHRQRENEVIGVAFQERQRQFFPAADLVTIPDRDTTCRGRIRPRRWRRFTPTCPTGGGVMHRRGRWVWVPPAHAAWAFLVFVVLRCGLGGSANARGVLAPRAGTADRAPPRPGSSRAMVTSLGYATGLRVSAIDRTVMPFAQATMLMAKPDLHDYAFRAGAHISLLTVGWFYLLDAARVRRRRDREQHLPRHCAAQRSRSCWAVTTGGAGSPSAKPVTTGRG